MVKKRLCLTLDEELIEKLNELLIRKIKNKNKISSLSKLINDILWAKLK